MTMKLIPTYTDGANQVQSGFLHGFKPSYIKTGMCEIFKNPSRKELSVFALGKNNQVRAFIVGNDLLVWNMFSALHQTVREELKLDKNAIPLNLYAMIGGDGFAIVTDNTRDTPWWHNGDVADAIEENPFIVKNFKYLEIEYYDSDIVGDWKSLNDEDDDGVSPSRPMPA